MFSIFDISNFTQFLKKYEIDYFFELDGESIDFFKEENGIYRHVLIEIELFNVSPMWKNIERLRTNFNINKEEK